jgi:hypothetical protein
MLRFALGIGLTAAVAVVAASTIAGSIVST